MRAADIPVTAGSEAASSGSVTTFRAGRVVVDRTIPFGSTSLQHGIALFEGIRRYPAGIFRLGEHVERLLASAAALGVEAGFDAASVAATITDAVRAHGGRRAYVRPVLFSPGTRLDVDPSAFVFELAVELWHAADPDPFHRPGLRLALSEWRRPSRLSFPPGVKATGMYVHAAVARSAAMREGFDDALQLDPDSGRVAEATTSNVFVVSGGVLRTPWLRDSLLAGITRDSVLRLAGLLGIAAVEGPLDMAEVFGADEVFLTGTALGLAPVTAVAHRQYRRGPVFTRLAQAFHQATSGGWPELGWLTAL